eukprot:51079_1
MGESFYCISSHKVWLTFSIIPGFCYVIGLSCIYLLYVLRLNDVFVKTSYKLSNATYYAFIAAFFIQICVPCGLMYIFSASGWSNSYNAYSLFIITNFTFNISLLFMFCHKIYIIGQDIVRNSDTNKIVNKKLHTLLTPTIRYAVCAFTAMLSSNILSIFGFYRSLIDTPLLWVSHLTFITMDQTINIFCLYLQYTFSNSQYQTCCSYVHKCVYKISINAIDDNNNVNIFKNNTIQSKNKISSNSECIDTTCQTSTMYTSTDITNISTHNYVSKS